METTAEKKEYLPGYDKNLPFLPFVTKLCGVREEAFRLLQMVSSIQNTYRRIKTSPDNVQEEKDLQKLKAEVEQLVKDKEWWNQFHWMNMDVLKIFQVLNSWVEETVSEEEAIEFIQAIYYDLNYLFELLRPERGGGF